jgi:hypothetical protein
MEARDADEQLNNVVAPRKFKDDGIWVTLAPLSTWTRFYKLQITEWIIQLGFETDLYLPSELCSMYILLGSYSDMRESMLRLLEKFARRRLEDLKKSGNTRYIEQCKSSLDWYRSSIALAAGTVGIAYALHHLYLLLQQTKVIDVTPKPYEEAQHRHEARMKPLLNLVNDNGFTLEHVTSMKENSSAPTIDEACERARKQIQIARMQLSELKIATPTQAKYVGTEDRWKRQLKSLETVCVAVTVTISQLARICEKHGKQKVDSEADLSDLIEVTLPPPGKRYHDWWVVPQLKEK